MNTNKIANKIANIVAREMIAKSAYERKTGEKLPEYNWGDMYDSIKEYAAKNLVIKSDNKDDQKQIELEVEDLLIGTDAFWSFNYETIITKALNSAKDTDQLVKGFDKVIADLEKKIIKYSKNKMNFYPGYIPPKSVSIKRSEAGMKKSVNKAMPKIWKAITKI